MGVLLPGWTLVEWLQVIERELLIFALFWFIIGMIDEAMVDLVWIALRMRSRHRTPTLDDGSLPLLRDDHTTQVVPGPASCARAITDGRGLAVFIPAWQEAAVIGATVGHMLRVWKETDLRLYVGCYPNDPQTVGAVMVAAGGDPRVRIVIAERPGPTTKADCLNRLYHAMRVDEGRLGRRFCGVILHDAEDMVHGRELAVIGEGLQQVDFVQLPVRPELPPGPHWVAGHYGDEFVESHARVLMVRDALGAALPAAGVGCGFSRDILERIGAIRGEGEGGEDIGPFAAECFTEDYEIGLLVSRLGGKSRFLRLRDSLGQLIATRSYFPDTLPGAVRQKTRWIHGIALQSWDRLGWTGRPVDVWMAMRDRRGPLVALVLAVAYMLLVIEGLLTVLRGFHLSPLDMVSPTLRTMAAISFMGLIWRLGMRFMFSAREYGVAEGLRAVARIPVANIITIMAGRRAFITYCRSLAGGTVVWDKTPHLDHPALTHSRQLGEEAARDLARELPLDLSITQRERLTA